MMNDSKMAETSSGVAIPPGSTIGIIGGGQLEKMTILAAANLGYKAEILCPDVDCPAASVAAKVWVGSYNDEDMLTKFADSVDVVTYEFENIPVESIEFLEKKVTTYPAPNALKIAQHRFHEKTFLQELGIPTAKFIAVNSADELAAAFAKIGTDKAILKSCRFGYDGKSQKVLDAASDFPEIWQEMDMEEAIVESFVPFEKEISAIVARNANGDKKVFPVAENVHKDGILDTSTVPADISDECKKQAQDIGVRIAEELNITGLLTVELFVLPDGTLLANEIAPRPHNSGHWTMDGCHTSQFEQLVRAICGLPLGSVGQHSPIVMKNLLGDDVGDWNKILNDPNARLYIYGKLELRSGRKTGHVNYIK